MPRSIQLPPHGLTGVAPFGAPPVTEMLPGRILHTIDQHLPRDADGDEPADRIEHDRTIRHRLDPDGFRQFVEESWQCNEALSYHHNWHIDAIALHVFALINGEIPPALLITVPPATMKSYLVSVLLQMYAWGPGEMPWLRFMNISYGHSLAKRDSLRCRKIIESPWHRETWPNARPRRDQNDKVRIENVSGGWRLATSVGGSATGDHPDVIVIDDALKASDANSEATRQSTNEWLGDTLTTRGITRSVKFVMACQRLALEDPPFWFLKAFPDAVHVNIPMEYDPAHPVRDPSEPTPAPCNWVDPRSVEGELLWPKLIDKDEVERIRRSFVYAHKAEGQLQQNPTAPEGELIKRQWFEIVDELPDKIGIKGRIRAWDLASTDGAGDWSVGLRMAKLANGWYVVEDLIRGQWGPGKRDEFIREAANQDGRRTRVVLEQAGNAGKDQCAAIARNLDGFNVRPVPVGQTGKLERADAFVSQLESGNVYLLRGNWNTSFIDELTAFPNGIHDDQLDACSMAFNQLSSAGRFFAAVG